jgi:hypothetical protein
MNICYVPSAVAELLLGSIPKTRSKASLWSIRIFISETAVGL